MPDSPPFLSDFGALQAALTARWHDETTPSRIRSIILDYRPSYRIDLIPSSATDPRLGWFASQSLNQDFAGTAALAAASVGRLDVNGVLSGTVFRIGPADGRLVATAAHIWADLKLPGGRIRSALPFKRSGNLNPSVVSFDPIITRNPIPVKTIRALHPWWDLMVLELDGSETLPAPLTIEPDAEWGRSLDNPVIVLGHPNLESPEALSPVGLTMFHDGPGLYVSPGLLNQPAGATPKLPPASKFGRERVLLRHEASTLRGFSGGPVVSLATGRVVGIHIQGGEFEGTGGASRPRQAFRRCGRLWTLTAPCRLP